MPSLLMKGEVSLSPVTYQAEMERIRRLPPEEQQKWMEKQQKLKQRRSMKVKTLRA